MPEAGKRLTFHSSKYTYTLDIHKYIYNDNKRERCTIHLIAITIFS